MMSALIQERLTESDSRQGWILDGFPRTLAQAQILEDLLQRLQQPCDLVIYFDVTTQLLLERLLQRGRHDDREEIICKRLAIYDEQTAPLVEFYQARKYLYPINGNPSADSVAHILKTSLASSGSVTTACQDTIFY
jgi:adenylate kinase